MSAGSVWPKDIEFEPKPRGWRAAARWLWVPAHESAGGQQPGLFQQPRTNGDPARVGICCSGGGLRSAAFSFGALDTLWRAQVLQKADFLAGVSGGSYAVTAATIVRATSKDWPDDAPGPYSLGSPELDYLRNRTDYLAPGLMGRWNMFLRLLLGILLNLAVVLGALYVIGRGAGWVYRRQLPALGRCTGDGCIGGLGLHTWSAVVIAGLAGIGLLSAVIDLLFRPGVEWWWRRLVRWTGTFVFAAIVAAIVLRLVPQLVWWARTGRFGFLHASALGRRGTGSVASAVVSLSVAVLHLVTKSGSSGGRGSLPKTLAKVPARMRGVLQKLAVGVVVPLSLAVFLVVAIDAGTRRWTTGATVVWLAVAVVVAVVMRSGNPIAWSAQPFYKRRLRTVFALTRSTRGGRVTVGPIASNEEPRLSELKADDWPTLLVCASAHVSQLGLTPPGLGVTSFVFSADFVGGPLVGSVPTAAYEEGINRLRWFQSFYLRFSNKKDLPGRRRDVSPLSAVSISGAAVAPSMGRMNQPAYRMLLALLNLRLGVWLPNPRRVRDLTAAGETFRSLVRPTYLVREMLGKNHLDTDFVYVADGGHYENLGLVELLRRGCTTIWSIDASGDSPGSIRSLGQAVALARSELGVEFDDLDPRTFELVGDSDAGLCKASHAVVHFRYPGDGGPGTLVYVKKALVRDEHTPADLLAYQDARPVFPNDSTGDQFYDVEQFEAYRSLGASATARAHAALNRPAGNAEDLGD